MQCYCSVLSLLLILSAILQHSWSRLSWNINSLGFQDPTLSRFISTSWTLWSPQTLKNGVHQGLTPRLFPFIYTPQVISSRLLTLYAIYMLMIPKYYNPRPPIISSFIYPTTMTKTKLVLPSIFIHFSKWQVHSFSLSAQKPQNHPWLLSFSLISHSKWQQILPILPPIYTLSPTTSHYLHNDTTWPEPLWSLPLITAVTPNCFSPGDLFSSPLKAKGSFKHISQIMILLSSKLSNGRKLAAL